jgi:hypothetical protein
LNLLIQPDNKLLKLAKLTNYGANLVEAKNRRLRWKLANYTDYIREELNKAVVNQTTIDGLVL